MNDETEPETREGRVIRLFEHRVREEIAVADSIRDLGLSDQAVDELTFGVVTGVLYGFSLDWVPERRIPLVER